MKKIKLTSVILITFSIILFMASLYAQKKSDLSNPEQEGYVPNEETAIRIAEAVWLPIYGKKIKKNKPFKAVLRENDVWVVEGTIYTQRGGVPYAEIQKKDGKILKITHGK